MSLRDDPSQPAGETIRPEPGLARGPFSAPPYFFYGLLGVTVLALALWLGRHRLFAGRRKST